MECVFCAELRGAEATVYHEIAGRDAPPRFVYDEQGLVAFPPLGSFVEGCLLIATREHYLSFAHVPADILAKTEELLSRVSGKLRDIYGRGSIVFEHGPRSATEKAACCVDHAHLNVFPVEVDISDELEQFPRTTISYLHELAAWAERDTSYLFLQTCKGERFVYDVDVIPSQYVRRLIARKVGSPDLWDWRTYSGFNEMRATLLAFSHEGKPR